jgi:hypothetical protein
MFFDAIMSFSMLEYTPTILLPVNSPKTKTLADVDKLAPRFEKNNTLLSRKSDFISANFGITILTYLKEIITPKNPEIINPKELNVGTKRY